MRLHCPAFTKIMPGKIKPLIFRLRKSIMIDSHVPFPGVTSCVAIRFQSLRNRNFRKLHSSAIPRIHKGMYSLIIRSRRISSHHMGLLSNRRMLTGHDRNTGRGTCGSWRISLSKKNSTLSKGINIGSLHGRRFINVITPHILPPQVICQNDHHIGSLGAIGNLSP